MGNSKEELIKNFCKDSGIEAWFVAKMEGSPGVLYGAFHSEGINIYKLEKAKPVLTQNHIWGNFTEATIDNFFAKTAIIFKGENHTTTLNIMEKGKDLIPLLQSNTELKITILPRPWWGKILGFRSKTKWKMAVAIVVYLFLIGKVVGTFGSNGSTTSTSAPVSTSEQAKKPPTQTAPDQASTQTSASAASSAPAPAPTPQKTPGSLGITPEEFTDRWNQALVNADSFPLKINNLKIESGSVQDTFTYMFNDSHGIMGTVNKSDGTIRDVMILAAGKDLADTSKAAGVIISWGLLIQATNPDLTPDQRGSILQDLGIMDSTNSLKGINKSVIRNNVKYNISQSDVTGLTFGASDPMDN
ncbi:hypothetical protein DEAC_c16850 [Desulfosporosinus acididurans]|uniref:Uncharacterized protein n=1 Tax=Desulfosporosinus acididurans TaxID=476652 RepID=A0A0J1INN7_9FIRM|nr:hypothetical protein [Desulfosporosinus acididurans]KLU66286.1 hypothetical protein DEAC_c16850 [Desulfosporosinus acididurans]